jgi:uncharacterized protein (TIGR03086 family)
MNEAEVFILSNEALQKVIQQIKDEQWELKAPEKMSHKPGTIRELVNYHAYDDAWVPDVLAGKTIAEVGDKYDGDLLGDDPKGSSAKYAGIANEAAKGFTDFEKMVHLSYGDFSASDYFKHITVFRSYRAWDMAKFLGVEPELSDELLQGMWDEFEPEAEGWRKMGVFGSQVEVADDADLLTKVLALSGRSR